LYTTLQRLDLSILSFRVFINMMRVLGMVKAIGHPNFIDIDLKEFEIYIRDSEIFF